MKKLTAAIFAIIAMGFVAFSRPAQAADIDGTLFSDVTLAYSTTNVLNVGDPTALSIQAVYSSATVTAPTFDDGRKATGTIIVTSTSGISGAHLGIAGYRLDQGDAWTTAATATGTAKAISDAIMAMPGLNAVIVSTWSSLLVGVSTHGVVTATAVAVGTTLNSSTIFTNVSSITVSGFSNGAASDVDLTENTVAVDTPPVPFSTGFPMWLQALTGTVPTGLTNGTTYFAIPVAAEPNKFKFATSSANARAGTAVDLTAVTGSGTFKMNPTAFAGTYSFKWQGSNDGSNWADLSVSSITYSAPGTTLWDMPVTQKYLRLNFTAGTGGGLSLQIYGYGNE